MLNLSKRITKITKEAGGKWGISLLDIDTNESWELNEHKQFYAASIIKIPIMIAVFAAAERQEIQMDSMLSLKKEDIVGGCGVLQHMTPGSQFSINDLVTLMIIQSDNTATNMLIDLIGTESIQKTMKEIGLEKSKFRHKMMMKERRELNMITAREMMEMLKFIVYGRVISAHARDKIIGILKKQQIRDSLPSKIREPDDKKGTNQIQWALAHKTGNVAGIRHDIGVFYVGKRTFLASVLSQGADDLTSPEMIGKIGLEIFNYLNEFHNS